MNKALILFQEYWFILIFSLSGGHVALVPGNILNIKHL